ncbi:MAG: siderophore biosynthesis protein [Paraprevotella sp.]|nr:siderophore biosynthesis protein [Paraprevotella sp.]
MPLFLSIEETGFRCCVWQVTETVEQLLDSLPCPSKYRMEAEARFSSPKRRLEYAAVRALLYEMTSCPPDVFYASSGKPMLADSSLSVSISHTKGYVAVSLSRTGKTGVDIERYSERILSLRDRIVGTGETADGVWSLLLHWSAKETVYKMMDCEGVDFVKHLCVSDFPETNSSRMEPGGRFRLFSSHPSCRQTYTVHYRLCPDFVLTYSDLPNDR